MHGIYIIIKGKKEVDIDLGDGGRRNALQLELVQHANYGGARPSGNTGARIIGRGSGCAREERHPCSLDGLAP